MEQTQKKVLVLGVIGADVHAVGNQILYHAFMDAGFEVINLGVMVSQEEFISAAIESNADAIVVSSLYGQGELDCRGMREKCREAGLGDIPLLVPQLHNERAADASAVAAACNAGRACPTARAVPDVASALAAARDISPAAADGGAPVVLCGSLYLLAEFFSLFPRYLTAPAGSAPAPAHAEARA